MLYKDTVKNMAIGFAYYKIITNKKGKPINFKILEVNPAFEKLTGFKAKNIIGKNINQIFPKTSEQKKDWIKLCGKVAIAGQEHQVERFFPSFNRWLRVYLFSPEKGYFVTLLSDLTDHRKTEQTLQESEEKYRNVVERAPSGIVLVIDGIIRYVNPAALNMWGGSLNDIIGKPFANFVHPDELPKVVDRYKKRMAGKTVPSRYEIIVKRKDGSFFPVEVDASLIMIGGKPANLVIVHDLTAQKKNEKLLTDIADQWQTTFNAVNDSIFIIDDKNRVVRWNRATEQILGQIPKKIKGCFCWKLIHKTDKPIKDCLVELVKKSHHRESMEVTIDSQTYQVSVDPIFDHHRKIIGYVHVLTDITESKKIQKELQTSEEMYRGLVNNLNIGIFRSMPDGDGRFIQVNPAMVRVLGYSSEKEFLKQPIVKLYKNPGDRKIFLNKIKKYGVVTAQEIPLIKKDGTQIIVSLTARAHKDAAGNIDWIDGVIEDITERKQQEDALRRREAILETVAFAAESFLKSTNWKSSIQEVLSRLGKAAQVSRVYIFEKHLSSDGRLLASQRFEWVAKDITPQINNPLMQNLDVKAAGFGRWVKILTKGQVLFGNVRTFPVSEQKILSAQNILSIAVAPIFTGQTFWGFIGFDECLKERRWTQIEIDSLRSAAGIIGSVIEANLIENELRTSEEKYRSLVQNVNIGVYRNSPDVRGRFIEINPAMVHMFGYNSPKELLKRSVSDLYQNPHDRAAFLNKMKKYGFVTAEELKLKKKDGTPIIGSVTARAHRDKTGKIDWIDGVIEDITERKRVEQALRESEERYRTVFETANDAIRILSPSGKLISANRRWFELTGLSEKSLGLHFSKFGIFPKQSLDIIQEKIAMRLLGKEVAPYEIVMHPKTGKPKIVEVNGALLRDASGNVVGSLEILRDITERKQVEILLKQAKESAEAANKAKTAFLANMSHELRTPMNSILGFTDILLEREENNNKERKELLGIIKNSSDKLLHIINELLDLSRIESGKMIVEKKEFNIIDMAYRLKLTYQPKAEEKGLKLNLKFSKNLPQKVIGDQSKIEQIITNLMDNAFKFTHKGYIEFYLGIAKDQKTVKNRRVLEYYVKDTGIGIEPDKMKNIFEQYLQADGYLIRKSGGARLGLAIVKQLVELMNGTIEVKSKIGKGTKFTIRQPVEIKL